MLNDRMVGRTKGGFTTCLALRLDGDGTLTLANAGHLAPYMNGKELETSPALPLGLAEGTYEEIRFHLAESDKLTLLTDGVIEARNKIPVSRSKSFKSSGNPTHGRAVHVHETGSLSVAIALPRKP